MNHDEALARLLDRPIAFHRIFAQITGSVAGGIFLSQAFYWRNRGSDAEGWFYKTQDEWKEETMLSRFEQEQVRKKLRGLGILEEERRGLPARLYFRIDVEKLFSTALEVENSADKYARNSHTGVLETDRLECEKLASYIYSENTSETTSENTDIYAGSKQQLEENPTPVENSSLVEAPNSDLQKSSAKKGSDSEPLARKRQGFSPAAAEWFRELYNENKPRKWAVCQKLNKKRLQGVKNLLNEESYAEVVQLAVEALKFAAEDNFWSGINGSIDTLLVSGRIRLLAETYSADTKNIDWTKHPSYSKWTKLIRWNHMPEQFSENPELRAENFETSEEVESFRSFVEHLRASQQIPFNPS